MGWFNHQLLGKVRQLSSCQQSQAGQRLTVMIRLSREAWKGWWMIDQPLLLGVEVLPRNLTWNLKIMVSKRNLLFQGLLFRFHVKFQGCKSWPYNKKGPQDIQACQMVVSKIFGIFTPIWGRFPFWRSYFFIWVETKQIFWSHSFLVRNRRGSVFFNLLPKVGGFLQLAMWFLFARCLCVHRKEAVSWSS